MRFLNYSSKHIENYTGKDVGFNKHSLLGWLLLTTSAPYSFSINPPYIKLFIIASVYIWRCYWEDSRRQLPDLQYVQNIFFYCLKAMYPTVNVIEKRRREKMINSFFFKLVHTGFREDPSPSVLILLWAYTERECATKVYKTLHTILLARLSIYKTITTLCRSL